MKTLGVIANCNKEHVPAALKQIARKAAELGLRLVSAGDTARHIPDCRTVPATRLADKVEAVLALGGDGTMLRVARELAGRDKPMIGIKLGGLGFLTSIAEDAIDKALECLSAGKYRIGTRSVLECTASRGKKRLTGDRALNDIVISVKSSRVATLALSVDGDEVTSYVSDGLIVSTPTGSTGHSLSAGGPIISPDSRVFVINLICPHTLSTRPLVVPDKSEIAVEVVKCTDKMLLSVDGQIGYHLVQGDSLKIRRSPKSVKFIYLPGYSYFGVLRQKLGWRGSNIRA